MVCGIENQVHFATIPVGVVKHGEAVKRAAFDGKRMIERIHLF